MQSINEWNQHIIEESEKGVSKHTIWSITDTTKTVKGFQQTLNPYFKIYSLGQLLAYFENNPSHMLTHRVNFCYSQIGNE